MVSGDDRTARLEEVVAKLAARVEALEARLEARPALPALSPSDAGLVELLRTREGGPYERGGRRGAVVYAGAVEIAEREYLWEMERPAPGLMDVPDDEIAAILSVLASPQRLATLKALLSGPKSSNDLQTALGVSSPGQLYHHLDKLLAAGIVEQTRRSLYQIAARHVIPVLAVIAISVDLAAAPRR